MKKWIQVILFAIGFFLVGLFMGIPTPTPSITDDIYVNTNYTCIGDCTGSGDPTILILLGILLPIVMIIGLFMFYIPRLKEDDKPND